MHFFFLVLLVSLATHLVHQKDWIVLHRTVCFVDCFRL